MVQFYNGTVLEKNTAKATQGSKEVEQGVSDLSDFDSRS